MNKIRTIHTLTVDSTVLCCNFVNTVYAWRGQNLHEYLESYSDIIEWCRKLNIYKETHLTALKNNSKNHPQKAARALVKLKEIRALLYHLITAIADGNKAQYQLLLDKINPLMADALGHIIVNFKEDDFQVVFQQNPVDLMSPAWPVLKSLYDLLTQKDKARIKECPTCGWVFLDETKNGRRRWCNPLDCGTADKMERYNLKKKENIDGTKVKKT